MFSWAQSNNECQYSWNIYEPNFVVGLTQGRQLCLKILIALMKSQLKMSWACKKKIKSRFVSNKWRIHDNNNKMSRLLQMQSRKNGNNNCDHVLSGQVKINCDLKICGHVSPSSQKKFYILPWHSWFN